MSCCTAGLRSAGEKKLTTSWSKTDTARFSFENCYTTRARDILLVLRNNDAYPFRNLYFFVTLYSPTARLSTDTLEYDMADKWGKWLGTGIDADKENILAYRSHYRLRESGTYRLEIVQGMRRDSLVGITAVG